MFLPTGAIVAVFAGAVLVILVIGTILATNKKARPTTERVRDGIAIFGALAAALFGVYVLAELAGMGRAGSFDQIIVDHFLATVGAPLAAFAAFCVVIGLRASYGALEFEVAGVKLKGASGPIVLWVLCFSVIVGALKLLW